MSKEDHIVVIYIAAGVINCNQQECEQQGRHNLLSVGVSNMYQKLPYYMAYPIQTEYDERAERTDLEYMKSLYPDLPKRILPYVEEECDRMEYTGSVMFDVYPDKLQLRIMCNRICENVKKQEKMFAGEERMLRNLAEVLLYQEIYRRRGEQRKRKQKIYSYCSLPGKSMI